MMLPENRPKHRGRQVARAAQLLLTSAGLLAMLYCGWAGLQMHASQKAAAAIGQPSQSSSPSRPSSQDAREEIVPAASLGPEGDPTAVIGRMEIAQIGLAVPITADITKEGLLRGAGHVPGTAFPGGLGTMGIAGHRDTFFRPLRQIRAGMQIKVTGAGGAYWYRVDSTEIVDPDEVKVLNIAAQPMLTLITCYPFNYIGAAPRRFIVHAHLLSAAPDKG
ncbi:class D sortase [Silvibacterium bohemicum]|nr:class D sortase [Silvibacterium bohemicum]